MANLRDIDREAIQAQYDDIKARGLNLDLTRGKPSAPQLDICGDILGLPGKDDYHSAAGEDVRNYGNNKGIVDIRQIWADLLGIDVDLIAAADGSSLNMMFDMVAWSHMWGNNDSERPWSAEEQVKWICPVPGYDRHFTITETFGYEMITVPWLSDGPDMDAIRELASDPQAKGMWIVPTFANPSGDSITEAKARELAAMDFAAPDFRVVWDNAYQFHPLSEEFPEVLDIIGIAAEEGHPNRFWQMCSSSKITQAGSGVSFFSSSKENMDWFLKVSTVRGIGPNKVNQLAHARFLKDADGVRSVMRKHAALMAPKFERTIEILNEKLGEYDEFNWTEPKGGYFISLNVVPGTASRVVELAKEAGVRVTGAGSSYPLHKDPENKNIRLAPSMPPIEDLEQSVYAVATCALLAAAENQ